MAFRPDTHRTATLDRRDAVLDAAIALIGEGGIEAVTHRAVAARAGVSKATTSYFFASIDALMIAAMRRVADTIIGEFQQLTAQTAGAIPDLGAAFELITDVLRAEATTSTIAQFETYLHAARRPELRPDVERVLDAFEQLAGDLLESVGAARAAAPAFIALADGFALHRIATNRSRGDATMLQEAFLALLRGYHPSLIQ
ncbi:TetR/AcrR family transcriptional regulator [Nocardia altamirensis]|uniref:TetR/AcrR family transcriptional regulator n=1 Tax=Nocardia altamirensis TaxID=472158 RepID=UPI00083FDC4D|nr:TetR family transcriptional regulator [Nocardia altamirensis]